jgi:cytochrome P450
MEPPRFAVTTAATDKSPASRKSLLERILGNARLLRGVARLVARFGPRVVTLGKNTFVFRWADVAAVCDNDSGFRIAPVNGQRIEAVSGAFILGMDRSDQLFRQRHTLYSALHAVDMAAVRLVMDAEADTLLTVAQQQSGRIDVVNSYARLVAGRVAARMFGISGPTEPDLLRVARAVFHETFLNLGNDKTVTAAGIAAGQELNAWIQADMAERRAHGTNKKDVLGALMLLVKAGVINDAEAAHILSGLLVGSIDTTATCVANIMAEIVSDPALKAAVSADLGNADRLWGWCLEILRRRPHNPLVLREAGYSATVAGKTILPGNKVYAITLSAMQDATVFDHPSRLDPTRPRETYLHFGRGLHLCAGRDLNAMQIPFLVGQLLKRKPTAIGTLIRRGPFPDELVVGLSGEPT